MTPQTCAATERVTVTTSDLKQFTFDACTAWVDESLFLPPLTLEQSAEIALASTLLVVTAWLWARLRSSV